ncbi:MAG: hypothetical protein LAO21_12595 [Acidobacteriia bacterium]|nr:hypothetical protein [Terriglobia bacterium]
MRLKRFPVYLIAIVSLVVLLTTLSPGQTDPNAQLRFAQVANGQTGQDWWVTTLIISNPDSSAREIRIESYEGVTDAGQPVPLALGFKTTCSGGSTADSYVLRGDGTCKFESSATGGLKAGWLRVTEKNGHNIGGYLFYTIYRGDPATTGFPMSSVGVSPMHVCGGMSIAVVRSKSKEEDTGLAAANPYNYQVRMNISLYDSSGTLMRTLIGGTEGGLELQPLEHGALFVSQLFPELANVDNFVGKLSLTGVTSNDGVIATALVAKGNIYGGAPVTLEDIHTEKSGSQPR